MESVLAFFDEWLGIRNHTSVKTSALSAFTVTMIRGESNVHNDLFSKTVNANTCPSLLDAATKDHRNFQACLPPGRLVPNMIRGPLKII